MMKFLFPLFMSMLLTSSSIAEMRLWTLSSGEQFEAEPMDLSSSQATLKNAEGRKVRIALKELSTEDRRYLELTNPPELSVDYLESAKQRFPKPSPLWEDASPVTLFKYSFGARIKQKSLGNYTHDLKVEIYAITQQAYDMDKYHLIAKITSPAFKLTEENDRRHEFQDQQEFDVIRFLLEGAQFVRGEKMAESLVLVRDERGEILTYNSTKKWLYKNLEQLEALPVGAWFNDSCKRVHPTSPTDLLTLWGEDQL